MKLFSLVAVLLLSPSVWAEGLNVSNLNHKIHNAGADWVAGPTDVGRLSDAEIKNLLGAGLDPHPDVLFATPELTTSATAATSLDWRNYKGQNWVTPIKNQGACGSCVAFASVETFETQYRISANKSDLSVNLSPQFVFSCGGGKCQVGMWPAQAATLLKNKGTPEESCMPYTSGSSGKDVACSAACSNVAKVSWRISGFSTPTTSVVKLAAIKAALKTGPLVTTLSVYRDFMYYKSGVYKHVSGEYMGGHAVSIVGYDDNIRAFIIRNSWGTNWGEDGFIRISYDDTSGIGASTWKYAVRPTHIYSLPSLNSLLATDEDASQETPGLTTAIDTQPRLTASLSEAPEIATALLETSSATAFEEIEMHQARRGEAERVISVPAGETAMTVQMKTAQWKNGEWEIYFVGRNKNAADRDQIESEHFFINVRN